MRNALRAWLLILAAYCLHHIWQVALLFIFHSRNKEVGDNPPFLGFCKSEVCLEHGDRNTSSWINSGHV